MQKKKSLSPLGQNVKGILFLQEGEEFLAQACKLMSTLDCEVLSSSNSRMMIKGSLGNIQSIKKCLLANDQKSTLSQELNECITQIIIGGKA